MMDWHLQVYRTGQPHGRSLTFSSAESAIEAGNTALLSAEADEIVVCHRLYSNQACLKLSIAVPNDELQSKASHLERQAQRASRDG
jgi:hypothetical protein